MLVWNFNKSMHDLGRGTKEMQVYVDGDLTWQGIVSRGCGNQTFDYSTVINLVDVPEVTKASASEGAAAAPAVTEEAASKESRSVSISRKGSGKGLDELSNEELLEELKRRSLPLESNSTPERQKEEKRGILPTAPPPKLSESERNASNAAPSPSKTTAANTDDCKSCLFLPPNTNTYTPNSHAHPHTPFLSFTHTYTYTFTRTTHIPAHSQIHTHMHTRAHTHTYSNKW
jgi:hypothetical protein